MGEQKSHKWNWGMKKYCHILNVLLFLFLLRVLGQLIVALHAPAWLPPMQQWYSGLIPYPILLPIQIVLITLMSWVNYRAFQGRGFFERRALSLGTWLQRFSYVYFGGMAIRYGITMWQFPGRRWLGKGTIPIIFHFVLAGYVYTLGSYYQDYLSEEVLQKP